MSVPDERIKKCMAGANIFFKYLGHVREMLMNPPRDQEVVWGGIMFSAGMMRESLDYLKACDPDLSVDELKHLVDLLYHAAGMENRVLVRETMRDIERFFERRYGELLDELERKGLQIMREEIEPWREQRRKVIHA
jgi:hypothetical protein